MVQLPAEVEAIYSQEQGKLNVDDSICNYITDCPEIFEPVKIRHLLSHSAGILNTTAYSVPGGQMVSKFARPFFPPGEQFKYQDVTYNLAGRIIETVSGQSYASFLKQTVFEPLGMSNTGVDDMYLWDQALYTDKLLPRSSLEAMLTPQKAVPGGQHYYGSIYAQQSHYPDLLSPPAGSSAKKRKLVQGGRIQKKSFLGCDSSIEYWII